MFLFELVICKHNKHVEIDFCVNYLLWLDRYTKYTINNARTNYQCFSKLALPCYIGKTAVFNINFSFF